MKYGESRDYVPRSNEHLMREFKKSVVWIDMEAELNVWLTEIRDLLEDPSCSDEITALLRGSAEGVRNVLIMPDTLADNFKTDKDQEKKEKEHGRENDGD